MARILVVDDEHLIVSAYTRVLRHNGHEVYCASRATKAGAILQKSEIDVIVSDLIMPGMNGISFMELVRRHWPEIPVILITGFPSLSSEQSARTSGAFAFLSKPVSVPELRATVEAAIEENRHRKGISEDEPQSSQSKPHSSPLKAAKRPRNPLQAIPIMKRFKLT